MAKLIVQKEHDEFLTWWRDFRKRVVAFQDRKNIASLKDFQLKEINKAMHTEAETAIAVMKSCGLLANMSARAELPAPPPAIDVKAK